MLTKKDCFNHTTWDYLGWKDIKYSPSDDGDHFDQTKWISTIITKINGISSMIHTSTYMGGVNTITINSKLLGLFALMPFGHYNHDKQTLSGRYQIVIDDNLDENIIFLSNIPKNPLIALPIIKKSTQANEYDTIEFKGISSFSDEEVALYKSKLNGYIEILNN